MPAAAGPSIGTSIVLITIGAMLKYAVDFAISGLEINTVGTILLIVGILALVLSIVYTVILSNRSRRAAVDDREVMREREYYEEPTRRRERY